MGRMKAYLAGATGAKTWRFADGRVIRTKSGPNGDVVTIFVPEQKGRVRGAFLMFQIVFSGGQYKSKLYASPNGLTWHLIDYPEDDLPPPYDITMADFGDSNGALAVIGTDGNAAYTTQLRSLVFSADPEKPLDLSTTEPTFIPREMVWVPADKRFRAFGLTFGGTGRAFYESETGETWTPFTCSLADAQEMEFAEIAASYVKNSRFLIAVSNQGLNFFRDTSNGIPVVTGIRSIDGGLTWSAAALPLNPIRGVPGPIEMTNIQYAKDFPVGSFMGTFVRHSNAALFPADRYIFTVWCSNGLDWDYHMFGVNGRMFGTTTLGTPHLNYRPAWSPRLQRIVLGGSHQKVTPAFPPYDWYDNSFIAYSDDYGVSWNFVDAPPQEWGAPVWSEELRKFVIFGLMHPYAGYTGPTIEHYCMVSNDGIEWATVELPELEFVSDAVTGVRHSMAVKFEINR